MALNWTENEGGEWSATGRHGHTFYSYYDHGWTLIIHNAHGELSEHSITADPDCDGTFLRDVNFIKEMAERIHSRLTARDNLPENPTSGPGWILISAA